MTDEARFLKKKKESHFLKFCSLVFLEITCNDSLQQCLTSSRGKTHEKIFWAQIWAKEAKIGPETFFFFFCHFLKFGSLVFLEIAYKDSLRQCIRSSRGKTHEKKKFGGPNLAA